MAGGDELSLGGSSGGGTLRRALAASLFIGAGTNVYDAFSAVMSSPWSTEKFTADSTEAKMAREYVRHALIISWVYAIGGALITASKLSVYPIVGAGIVTAYMTWLYRRAIGRGESGTGMGGGQNGAHGNNAERGVVHFSRSR